MAKILITGTAGFIGFHLAKKFLDRGDQIVGLDSINEYYDIRVKHGRLIETGIDPEILVYNRLVQSTKYPEYKFIQLQLEDAENINKLFKVEKFDRVINLAAQAGVRYSLENPRAYIDSNIVGFGNILEACRHYQIEHLTYASSSSVYGLNESLPFSTQHNVDHPISLYAASKKSNELMAHTYSHLFGLPTTGLRFFTVYGPWGRPDMALFLFTKAILERQPIQVFNNGEMSRDFTYVDDIVKGIIKVSDNAPQGDDNWSGMYPNPAASKAPYKIYNIGNNSPVKLMDFISILEDSLGLEAIKEFKPMQAGDVPSTYANLDGLIKDMNYKPNTDLKYGVKQFVEWYKQFYN